MWWRFNVLVYKNGKMTPVETIPGVGAGMGDKGEWWREDEFNYDILQELL
jgi:hypothetical protein